MKKIVVVGGVAGGASAAARIRRLDEQAQIVMFEKGPHVSFSNCSLPYHLSGIVENSDRLVLMNPQSFETKYNIDARVLSEVVKINRDKKTVTVRNVATDDTYEEAYDELILSTGASPIVPRLEGVELPHVFTVRNVVDIENLQKAIIEKDAKNIAVIGGGFIEELPEVVLLSRVFTIGSTAAIRADLCSDGGAGLRVGDCHLVAVAQGLAATGFGRAVDRHHPFGEDVLGHPSGLHEVGEFQELPQPDLGVTDGYDR